MDRSTPNYLEIMNYIDANPIAVLSTLNEDGSPYGAVVYVCIEHDGTVYFVTKNHTKKFINCAERSSVSLTAINEKESSSLQASGHAAVVKDPQTIKRVTEKIARIHTRMPGLLSPISKLRAGNYEVVSIQLTAGRIGHFGATHIGSKDIFTELN